MIPQSVIDAARRIQGANMRESVTFYYKGEAQTSALPCRISRYKNRTGAEESQGSKLTSLKLWEIKLPYDTEVQAFWRARVTFAESGDTIEYHVKDPDGQKSSQTIRSIIVEKVD